MKKFSPVSSLSNPQLGSNFEIIDQAAPMTIFSQVTESPNFRDGITSETHRAAEFRDAAELGISSVFDYIAHHVNPHQIKGTLKNILCGLSVSALNQNCVICSKAVEKNLAALQSGQINDFWVAESTTQGWLPQNVSSDHYKSFSIEHDQDLSSQLLCHSQVGRRYIITVPVRDKDFSHAMNLVRIDIATIVIDGQHRRCYNLDDIKDKHKFNEYYGSGHGVNVVQIYNTGGAPDIDDKTQDS